jgi:predicted nuclease of predicted toxin-antitoxin system
LKLLFDQNLSRKLVTRLADIFPESSHVQFHNLTETDDSEIWEFAKTQGFCIVTQDADFAERSRLYGTPPKVIWLRCGNTPTSNVAAIFRSGVETIREFMDNTALDCLELY